MTYFLDMTTIGHTIVGATIGLAAIPRYASRLRSIATLAVFGLLGNFADWPIKNWGHDRYEISHSVFSNLAVIAAVLLISAVFRRQVKKVGGYRILLLGCAAMVSHLLLDTFYSHGTGLGIYWPFSGETVSLALPWFDPIKVVPPPLTRQALRVMGIELLFYGTIFILAGSIKYMFLRKVEE
ncbi:MAG: hypothetical protein GF398_03110 [Chitinivibrionales bacterium]|nr:hypothetical protein [Chitinivibrionales bacterium]